VPAKSVFAPLRGFFASFADSFATFAVQEFDLRRYPEGTKSLTAKVAKESAKDAKETESREPGLLRSKPRPCYVHFLPKPL
jgi:hypothetical protein